MSGSQHVHVIDGKIVAFDEATCPICHPELVQQRQQSTLPRVYRKGDTIIVQVSKGIMSTTTYWAEGKAILHSVRRIQRDANGRVIRGQDGNPLWTQLTMRMSIAIAKQYVTELSKMINEIESQDNPQPANIPQRG